MARGRLFRLENSEDDGLMSRKRGGKLRIGSNAMFCRSIRYKAPAVSYCRDIIREPAIRFRAVHTILLLSLLLLLSWTSSDPCRQLIALTCWISEWISGAALPPRRRDDVSTKNRQQAKATALSDMQMSAVVCYLPSALDSQTLNESNLCNPLKNGRKLCPRLVYSSLSCCHIDCCMYMCACRIT